MNRIRRIAAALAIVSCTSAPAAKPSGGAGRGKTRPSVSGGRTAAESNTVYRSFYEEPKHLDPAMSYLTWDARIICDVLEPPFQYHYLKRPHELVPLTAAQIPVPKKRRVTFQGKTVEAIVYTIRLKPRILYQNHPCFVEANRRLTEKDLRGIRTVWDIKRTDKRELTAADYVHAIRRLADPRLACPVYPVLGRHFLGMDDYRKALVARLTKERAARGAGAGPRYNEWQNERYNPIRIDYAEGADDFPFVRRIDRHTFEIALKRPHRQILYWMAMLFFAPVPPEAVEFFNQEALLRRGIVLDKNLVGTGPYMLREFDLFNQIVLERNPNFRLERYPALPRPPKDDLRAQEHYRRMKAAGMLDDAGKRLPMIDRIVYRREPEWRPRWNKFLQGRYAASAITSGVFDQTVTRDTTGRAVLKKEPASRGIRLLTAPVPVVYYFAFNMRDPLVGGYTEAKRKLRRAISIAFDIEEEMSIFSKGRGIVAHSPLPPWILGNEGGRAGINPFVYRWDEVRKRAVRRSLEEAKKLLAEAGYPNGYDSNGKQLTIRFNTAASGTAARLRAEFFKKQFKKLNIRLDVRASGYKVLLDKVLKGDYQFLCWGWIADYPDPQNFLFLLYGPNGKVASGGENTANYENKEYDKLFERMENTADGPKRLAIIRKMLHILRRDSPWIFGSHPVRCDLYHRWYRNTYPHGFAHNTTKYNRIDSAGRTAYRKKHAATPDRQASTDKTRRAKAAFLRIEHALWRYRITLGTLPTKEHGLKALVVRPKYDTDALAAKWTGPYLRHVPKDPWGNPYTYEAGKKARLYSMGPDGAAGTADDIVFPLVIEISNP